MKRVALCLVVLNLACGPKDGKTDPNATKEQEGDLQEPTCAGGEVKIRYPKGAIAGVESDPNAPRTVDDVAFDEVTYAYGSHEITSGMDGGHALLKFGKDMDNKLVFAYQDSKIEDGDVVAMRGYVDTDKIDVGNCEDPAEYYSKLTWITFIGGNTNEPQVATFVLRQLKNHPYCDGEPFAGTVSGCFAEKN